MTDPPKPRAKDLSQMQLFNETVNRLRRRKFVHDMVTKPSGVTISGRIGERIKAEIRGPDEEAVDAMILALRLLKQNDPTSLRRMAQLYERLPVESPHKTYFLDARAKINAQLDEESELLYERRQKKTGKVVYRERFTNRRVLDLLIYGERAHPNPKLRAIVQDLRKSDVTSVLLDNTFNIVALEFLDGVFYLQIQNAALYQELTGKAFTIDWPTSPPVGS